MIKTQEDFFNKIYIPLTLFVRVRKGCVGFYCERELEIEHNCNILTPNLWPSRCLSCSSDAQPDPWGPLCWVLAFFIASSQHPKLHRVSLPHSRLQLHPIFNSTQLSSFCSIRRPYITFKLPRGDMDTPPRLRNFFRYLVIGMCHFRSLWNGLCDRHRAEITVMQFRGHSLPVRQSMTV